MKILKKEEINLSDYIYRFIHLTVNDPQMKNIFKKRNKYNIFKKRNKYRTKIVDLYNKRFGTDFSASDFFLIISLVVNNCSFITKESIKQLCDNESFRKNLSGYYVTFGGVEINGIKLLLSESKRGSDIHFVDLPSEKQFDEVLLILVEKINNII